MQILSLALQNFKTHPDKYVEFQPGINAICGENGAGKTSLLEAIAWVLFNYQGDYAKEDLIRNGSGSAQVTVRFTSNYDHRTYEVQRCTQRGYTLFDPQLNERLPYSRIKDEVLPWLKQHIGVPLTTNLPQLFARTVGVPQGTFTADFLQSAEQRKAVFDAILKVEDYKLAYRQMNSLRRYAEDQVHALKQQIAQYEESLTQWDPLQQRQQSLQQDIQTSEQHLEQLQKTLADLTLQRQALHTQKQHIQTLQEQHQAVTQHIHRKQDLLGRLEQSLQQAQQAIQLCNTHAAAYQGYQASEQELQVLSQRQRQRQTLQNEYRTLQSSRSQQQTKLAQLRTQLDGLVKTEQDLALLQPQIEQQVQLENQQKDWQRQIDRLQQLALEKQTLDQQLLQIQQQAKTVEASCQRLAELEPATAEIPQLEKRRDRTQQQLNRLNAARQFEQELRDLVHQCQNQQREHRVTWQESWADIEQKLTNLPKSVAHSMGKLHTHVEAGAAITDHLLAELNAILNDLTDQTNAAQLSKALKNLQHELTQRYRWQGELVQLEPLREQLHRNQQQQGQIQNRIQGLQQTLVQRETVEQAVASVQQSIKDLGYPREKSEILTRTLTDKTSMEQNYATLLASQSEQDQQLVQLTSALDDFQGLDQAVEELQQRRTECQAGYNLYLQHQNLATQHPQLQQEFEAIQIEIKPLQAQLKTIEGELSQARQNFDEVTAVVLENQYQSKRSEADQLSGRLPEMHHRLKDIGQQIKGLEDLAEKRNLAQKQLKGKEKAKRFINFARRVYKEAGPRITEQYVRAISYQADRLFRELLGRPNVALEWTRDYEILVQEGANQRRFVNLSGGEQMCAALAVRLALLKVLADIDIAFFDEPTTNMDRARRESLAEAIGRIKAFQQLFVISHDDTFEKVTENIIYLERNIG